MTILFLFVLLFLLMFIGVPIAASAGPGRLGDHHAVQPGLGTLSGDQAVRNL